MKKQANAKHIEAVIGERIRQLRDAKNMQQEILALHARQYGLPWSRPRVAMLESGKRGLSLGEFLVLPDFLSQTLNPETPFTYADLLPAETDTQPITLTPGLTVKYPYDLHQMIHNEGVLKLGMGFHAREEKRAAIFEKRTEMFKPVPKGRLFYDDVSLKAARLLKVPMAAVVKASRKLWGHPMSEERNDRLAQENLAGVTPRQQQAKRGHITRKLIAELQPVLMKMGVKLRQSTRKKKGGKAKGKQSSHHRH